MKVTVSRSDRVPGSFTRHKEVFSDEADGEDHILEVVIETDLQTFKIRESARGILVEHGIWNEEGTWLRYVGLEPYSFELLRCKKMAAENVIAYKKQIAEGNNSSGKRTDNET